MFNMSTSLWCIKHMGYCVSHRSMTTVHQRTHLLVENNSGGYSKHSMYTVYIVQYD